MQHVNHNSNRAPGFDPRLFLRDEELDYGISLILTAERTLMKQAATLAEAQSIPPLAARALITIRFEPGLTVSHIRDQLGATVPTMARILADLDQDGLLERRKSKIDARQRALHLTQDGLRATDPAVIGMRNAIRNAYRRAGSGAVAGARAVMEALG